MKSIIMSIVATASLIAAGSAMAIEMPELANRPANLVDASIVVNVSTATASVHENAAVETAAGLTPPSIPNALKFGEDAVTPFGFFPTPSDVERVPLSSAAGFTSSGQLITDPPVLLDNK